MEEFKSRPKIDVDKLDFSEFHPLDHNIWQCRDEPGGRRTHLKYRWQFQWSQALRAKTTCKLGWHYRTGQAHRRADIEGTRDLPADHPDVEWVTWKTCSFCFKGLTEPQPE